MLFHIMTTLQFHVVQLQGYEEFHIVKFFPFPRTDKISFPHTDAPPVGTFAASWLCRYKFIYIHFQKKYLNLQLLTVARALDVKFFG